MAILHASLSWVAALVALAILTFVSITFVYLYSATRERSKFVSVVAVLSLTCLLATVCLLPVDIALVSFTTSNKTGLKKHWATPEYVAHTLFGLKVVYYILYSLDALLCLVVIPFAYFWYEEWDVESTAKTRVTGALKYSAAFLVLVLILFLVGFFIPAIKTVPGEHLDLDFFKKLLTKNRGERALTFIVGVLLSLGTVIYVLYTAPGIALFPISLIKSIPQISVTSAQDARDALALNREHQRMIDARSTGPNGLSAKDKRDLTSLQQEERRLTRRERLAEEGNHKWLLKADAIFRPFKMLFGFILLVLSMVVVASMLITLIDKLRNSVCGSHCGYILPQVHIFNPINYLLLKTSKVFPVDYILTLLLVIFFFVSSVVGLAYIGIRFLWVVIFKIRRSHTRPQALLMGTVMLMLAVIAINYALTMIVAPQYSHFGGQKYCSRSPVKDCSIHPELILDCSSAADIDICTPTVVSTFINRITLNFPFFGVFAFWAQFVFVGVFIITTITGLISSPKMDFDEFDEDAEEEEEESLLGASRTRLRGAWEDVTGRSAATGSTA